MMSHALISLGVAVTIESLFTFSDILAYLTYLDDAFERSEEVAPGTAPLLFSAMVAKSSSVESDTMDEVVVVLLLRNASEKNSPSASSQVWPPSPPGDDIFSLSST